MKRIFGVIVFLMLCFGVSFFTVTDYVIADDDTTFSVTLEEGYDYGDISKCKTYYKGHIISVNNTADNNNYNMCLYSTEARRDYNHPHDNIQCSDSSMDIFKITVAGSNGATYYGYSCRKPKSVENIETKKETINVGQEFQIPNTSYYETNQCSIVSGDAGHLTTDIVGDLQCFFVADKEGSVIIRATTNDKETVYYEYNIINAFSSVSDLDQNYDYGSVDSCDLIERGFRFGVEINFDNLTFCGSISEIDPINSSISCSDEGYEVFSLKFSSNGNLYYGYGCRKPKSNDVIDYIEQDLTVGSSFRVGDDVYDTCSIISGTAGRFNTSNFVKYPCLFIAEKEGIVEVKAVNNKNNMATYYRLKINANYEDPEFSPSEYKDLICEVKSVLTKKTSSLYNINQIKLSGVLYNIEDIDCSIDIKCDENNCEYILEQKLKNTANYCNNIYSQSSNYGSGNYTGRLEECVQFQSFYSSLVTNGIIRDLSNGCKMLSNDFVDKLDWILDIIKIAGPILAVGLGTLDFVKVVASGDADKEMKSAFKRFGTRIVAAVLLFLVPVILAFLMDTFLGNQAGYDSGNPFCDIVEFNE